MEKKRMFEKIMVCLDGSTLAEQILPSAIEQAKHFQRILILMRVVPPPETVSMPPIPGTPGIQVPTRSATEHVQERQLEAERYLEKTVKSLSSENIKLEQIAIQGNPGETIVNYASENGVGLIAIATHGRSGLGSAVFGSVANYVLREAGIPILLFKPKMQKEA